MDKLKRVLVLNTPVFDEAVNRDMAGGLGYKVSSNVVLPPIDMLLVATALQKLGKTVFFVDGVAEKLNFEEVRSFIEKKEIGLVAASLSLPSLSGDIKWLKFLTDLGLQVIVKTGINYSEILRRVLRETGVEKIVYGEPELTMDKILKSKDKIIDAGIVADLNKLPIPYRQWLKGDLYSYGLLPGKITTMQISRGCPFGCAFYCPYPLVQGKRWRAMGIARVLAEMEEISKLGIKNILFRDATFSLDQERTIRLCREMIKKGFKFNWWCETRANVLDEETLKWMKRAGCRGINLGVETMDEGRIFTEGKPGVKIEGIVKISDMAKNLGIKLHFLMILGLPEETVMGLYKTFKWLLRLRPESVGFSLITPYPGTALFDLAKREKLISNFDWDRFDGSKVVMRTRNLSVFELKLAKFLMMFSSWSLRNKNEWMLKIINIFFMVWIGLKNDKG